MQRETSGQCVMNLLDAAIRLLQVNGLKWGAPTEQCIPARPKKGSGVQGPFPRPPLTHRHRGCWDSHDTAKGPHVCLGAMALSLQHFRSHIIGSTTDGPDKGQRQG